MSVTSRNVNKSIGITLVEKECFFDVEHSIVLLTAQLNAVHHGLDKSITYGIFPGEVQNDIDNEKYSFTKNPPAIENSGGCDITI
ncbi:hypothetical protein OXR01_09635 [Staphylococcus gallinarum]|uniref:hypothetical protein n=1 Tax=Staphylococcus gallinarum TaxID=1293 RepID=UPI001E53EECD|nr:hypothetical protein [Staphylococcus gallinarum]MCD8829128.1 hypothetical protein [Staphylococcus gallinarum]MDN6414199.1 hypothetical protein [Staphylococcus gallinarum]